jgi:hypothetical protein
MMLRTAIAALLVLLVVACAPSSIDLSNATDDELDTACTALSQAGYDYWQIADVTTSGRVMEVAASIHTDHPGPDATRKYCEGR